MRIFGNNAVFLIVIMGCKAVSRRHALAKAKIHLVTVADTAVCGAVRASVLPGVKGRNNISLFVKIGYAVHLSRNADSRNFAVAVYNMIGKRERLFDNERCVPFLKILFRALDFCAVN